MAKNGNYESMHCTNYNRNKISKMKLIILFYTVCIIGVHIYYGQELRKLWGLKIVRFQTMGVKTSDITTVYDY